MIQKVLKVGSSLAVTIPKKSLKDLGIHAGGEVSVVIDVARKRISFEPVTVVDRELVDWTRGFIAQYRQALGSLAK